MSGYQLPLFEDDDFMARARRGERLTCPTCGQRVKRYRRYLHTQMARFLLDLAKMSQATGHDYGVFIHIRDMPKRVGEKVSSDAAYLNRWGLVDKRATGEYVLTHRGMEFVRGHTRVPKYKDMLCGEVIGEAEETVNIQDCLETTFNLTDLFDAENETG